MRTITVLNPKGGSAKTTTVVNLAAELAALGRSVLVLDMDPQGSASAWLGVARSEDNIIRAIRGAANMGELAMETTAPGVELVQSSPVLVTDNSRRESETAHGFSRAIERLPAMWDFVLIDCPPTLGYLGVVALAASDGVLVPVPTHVLGLAGLADLMAMVDRVQATLNPDLVIDGILLCRTNRSVHSRQVGERIRASYPDLCFRTQIRETIRLAEAPGFQLPITRHAPRTRGDEDYLAAALELIERLEGFAPIPEPRPLFGAERL